MIRVDKYGYLFLTALLIFCSAEITAQADISRISIKIGVIRNYQDVVGDNGYSAYDLLPEFEVGGNFFLENMHWGISFGTWDDDIEQELFRDYVTISYKAVSITPKLYYSFNAQELSPGSLVTSLFAGLSYQVVTSTPLTSVDVFGNKVNGDTKSVIEPIIGSGFGFIITESISLSGEIAYHVITRNVSEVHQVEYKLLVNYGF